MNPESPSGNVPKNTVTSDQLKGKKLSYTGKKITILSESGKKKKKGRAKTKVRSALGAAM